MGKCIAIASKIIMNNSIEHRRRVIKKAKYIFRIVRVIEDG